MVELVEFGTRHYGPLEAPDEVAALLAYLSGRGRGHVTPREHR
ncbi:hypothetical protein ACIHAX_03485 [Nocardia sp. NPDC051929]